MTTADSVDTDDRKPAQTRNLVLALLAFAITFWAWNLVGPLGVRYSTELGLTATQKSCWWPCRCSSARWAAFPSAR